MFRATAIIRADKVIDAVPAGHAVLERDERHLRRKAIALEGGEKVLVDFAEPVVLEHGDRLVLDDGREIEIRAASEDLYEIRGRDPLHIAELAWHIGNRHTPCRIEADRLIIRQDHVLEAMLRQLGAEIQHADLPFRPEGGAYGHGRTFGHDHGSSHHHAHDHSHDHHHA